MKKHNYTFLAIILFTISYSLSAQETVNPVPVYSGSHITYDDQLGYDEFFVCTGIDEDEKSVITKIEGYIHHRFCYAPEGRSPLEIIKNYEEAVIDKGGMVFPFSNARECIDAFLKKGHPGHGMQNYEYMQLPGYAGGYFCGKIPTDTADYYVTLIMARVDNKVVYSLVTIKTKPMDTGMISLDNLDDGILSKGHIAIYDIYFDTGRSEIKGESNDALKTIAEYLKTHADKKYLVVGHTDNIGEFEANIVLSTDRANEVVHKLIVDHGVNKEQLKPYGVGPASPVASNSTEEGKAKNRRVDIVQR